MISNQSLGCIKGDNAVFEIDMSTEAGPVDLTGATALWALAESWFDGALIFLTKTSAVSGGITITNDAGTWKIIIQLAPSDTLSIPSGTMFHECKVMLSDASVAHVASGTFILEPSLNPSIAPGLRGVQSLATIGQTATATAPTLSAQVVQFFDRLLTLPSTPRQALYSALIDGLVADGVWASLDVLCVAGADAATSLTNLVQGQFNAEYNPPSSVAPVFTPDRGFNGDFSNTAYIFTNFNLATNGGNFVQDSAMMAAWNLGLEAHNWSLFSGGSNIELYPSYSGTSASYLNSTFEWNGPANTHPEGFFCLSRTGSSNYGIYRNGTLIDTATRGSIPPTNANVIVAANVSSGSDWITACWVFGGGLDSTKAAALYNRLHTYFIAVGAV